MQLVVSSGVCVCWGRGGEGKDVCCDLDQAV